MPYWDVEVDKLFDTGDESFKVPFHGAGVMVRPNGRWNMVAVELDLRRVPVEKDRERLVRFVLAQSDRRFSRPENREEFPVWVLIAQDEFRLQDYYAVLRATATAQQVPMPRAYLTTFAQMRALRDDPAQRRASHDASSEMPEVSAPFHARARHISAHQLPSRPRFAFARSANLAAHLLLPNSSPAAHQ